MSGAHAGPVAEGGYRWWLFSCVEQSNISDQDPDVQVALAQTIEQMITNGQLTPAFVNTRLLRVCSVTPCARLRVYCRLVERGRRRPAAW